MLFEKQVFQREKAFSNSFISSVIRSFFFFFKANLCHGHWSGPVAASSSLVAATLLSPLYQGNLIIAGLKLKPIQNVFDGRLARWISKIPELKCERANNVSSRCVLKRRLLAWRHAPLKSETRPLLWLWEINLFPVTEANGTMPQINPARHSRLCLSLGSQYFSI